MCAATARAGKILVVDDNPIIQRTFYFALHGCGYEVITAGALAEALNLVRKENLNLILLDINFPIDAAILGGGMRDGFQALEWIRRLDELKGVPVVMISGDDPTSASPRALAAGAAAYLHKPIAKEILTQTVGDLLSPKPSA